MNQLRLTPQQQELTAQLRDFFAGHDRYFILKGYAGTGKTFLIGQLAKELTAQNREVVLLAPTGRAARVLSRKTGCPASTIHRHIYNLKELVEHDDATIAFKFYFRVKDVATDNLDQVVFVDEASMVSDQYSEGEFLRFGSGRLLSDLLQFLRISDSTQKTKLVMVGDPAQLPPVNSPISPALDGAYLNEVHGLHTREYELTAVVRQTADSAILREATAIRETLSSPHHNRLSIRPAPPHIESLAEPDLPGQFVQVNQGTRLPRTICVAYSNATCLNLNVAIRSTRFGGDGMQSPTPGDVLLVIRNSASTGLLNGDLISVMWADENAEKVRVRVGTEYVELSFRSVRVVAESEDGSEVELGTKIVENVLFSEKRDLSPLEQKALFVHFKTRFPKLRPNTKEFTEALRADPYFNALQVKFGYAITCHKAQGGEWDDVFVFFEHARTDALALRWAYTALTRARNRVFGINMPDRQPWAGITPRAKGVRRVARDEDAPVAGPQPSDRPLQAPPTQWDEMFPPEPAFSREYHRQMVAALLQANVAVENVEVRTANHFWRYDVCKDGRRARLQIYFRGNGAVTPQVVPIAGSDPDLGQQVLPLLMVQPVPVRARSQPVTFPSDKPFLRAFHEDFMAPRVEAAGAAILCVDHHQFLEKYHLAEGATSVVVAVDYSARGTITSIRKESGDDDLYGKIVADN
jgi:hypothetical protein